MTNETRERLADYAHEAWSCWMRYLFRRTRRDFKSGGEIIPPELVERWRRQANTPYVDLPENEKPSDLRQADRILTITNAPELLEAVKLAYRKHHLEDQSIEWEELTERLDDALCNTMGPTAVVEWVTSIINGEGA